MIVEQIQTFKQQKKSDEIIKIKINKKLKENNLNKQQIEKMFINAQTVLKKETAKSGK